jgi:ribosomal protein S18 acetylase RimI-like enzyme
MSNSSTISPAPPSRADSFRSEVRSSDAEAILRLVTMTGVFSTAEIAIAEELVLEHLNRGAEASGYYFLFADGPEGIEGYTCFGPIPGTVRRWELYWIAVDPRIGRGGWGRRLQRASEDAVRAMGGVFMVAETSTKPSYTAARAFYRSEGYGLLAEIPDWYDEGDGLAIFGKRL